jgi:hypothetical protein
MRLLKPVSNICFSQHLLRVSLLFMLTSLLFWTDLLHDKKRARLKTLDEYYFIRGGTSLTGTGTKELTAITLEENAKLADRRRLKKTVFGLSIIAIAEALLLLRFLAGRCESLPLILYPFCTLIGCQKHEDNSYSNPSGLKVRNVLPPQTDVMKIPMSSLHGKKRKQKSELKLLSFRWPRVMSIGKRKAVLPRLTESPCFWGHCNISPQSRLPWGVRLEHLPMPSDFEYQLSQELALMSEQLASVAHSFVCESVDIQSNISDTALKKLIAAENSLQAVEYYETTSSESIDFLSNGLKYVVRFVIDFLESFLILLA